MIRRFATRCVDRIAWETYYRLPWEWEAFGRKGLRARFARICGDRARAAINERRFIP